MEVYVIYDAALTTIKSIHSSLALAEIAKIYYATEALNNIINDDPKETGINWEDMTKFERQDFYKNIEADFEIKVMTLDKMDGEEEIDVGRN